jgi:hypothetical protein
MNANNRERNIRQLREAGIALVDALVVANDPDLWAQWADLGRSAIATAHRRLGDTTEPHRDTPPGEDNSP